MIGGSTETFQKNRAAAMMLACKHFGRGRCLCRAAGLRCEELVAVLHSQCYCPWDGYCLTVEYRMRLICSRAHGKQVVESFVVAAVSNWCTAKNLPSDRPVAADIAGMAESLLPVVAEGTTEAALLGGEASMQA